MKLSQLAILFNIISMMILVVTAVFTQMSNQASLFLGGVSLVILVSTFLFYLNSRTQRKHQ